MTDPLFKDERVEITRCPRCGGLPRPTLLGRCICDRCGGLDVPQEPSPRVLQQLEELKSSNPLAQRDIVYRARLQWTYETPQGELALELCDALEAERAATADMTTEIERLTADEAEACAAKDAAYRLCDQYTAEIERLRAALERINTLACYASEENTDSRGAVLLEIGKLARGVAQPDETPVCTHDWTLQVDKADYAIYCCEHCGKFVKRSKDTQPCPDQ
ncbi:MAG: hypothetical protein WB992_04810 [Bryobacteraceae bacterium]